MIRFDRHIAGVWVLILLAGCSSESSDDNPVVDAGTDRGADACDPGPPRLVTAPTTTVDDAMLSLANELVIYELQVRSANACRVDVGTPEQRQACEERVAHVPSYRAVGVTCDELPELQSIQLGTLDDLVEDTAEFREGITTRYLAEEVGVNAVWLQPVFPNNDIWSLPAPCDNLGSPYAVRDYFHPRGTLGRTCIEAGADEYSDEPCWADDALDAFVADANDRGIRVMLDVAFNHFGHQYRMYDVADARGYDELVAGGDSSVLWDFDATFDESLVEPTVADSWPAILGSSAWASDLDAFETACPGVEGDDHAVRAFHMFRAALPSERIGFDCDAESLQEAVPSFFVSRGGARPASGPGDVTNDYGWNDVHFLFHHPGGAYEDEALRNREYLFRVLNYWVARGVGGFRLDHATDGVSGQTEEFWAYVYAKLTYYAELRGQDPPVFLAEEFHNPDAMADVAHILTEGYLFDMNARDGRPKDDDHARSVFGRAQRYLGEATVLTHLENHDELRLTDGTGFDAGTGFGFWALGAATWSTPMLLAGQEFGQEQRFEFRRSDYIEARFDTEPWRDGVLADYRSVIDARLEPDNTALRSPNYRFLQTTGDPDPADAMVAFIKWSADGDAMIGVHNLWRQDARASFFVPEDAAATVGIDRCAEYRLTDLLGPGSQCVSGAELLEGWSVWMGSGDRLRWWTVSEGCE